MGVRFDHVSAGGDIRIGHITNVYQVTGQLYPALADYTYDFGGVLAATAGTFVGRTSILAQLAAFVAEQPCGYFEIVAGAGLGKTALAAEIVRRYDAPSFFASRGAGLVRSDQCLNHLAVDLITRFQLGIDHLPARAGEDSTFLLRRLDEAARKAPRPLVLVVDAVDEADDPPAGANPLLLPAQLPRGVFVVATRRRTDPEWLLAPDVALQSCHIAPDDPGQREAIEAYLRLQATQPPIAAALARAEPPIAPETFVARLRDASEGNFMYVRYQVADAAARRPSDPPLDLAQLPPGLAGYYAQFWSQMEAAKGEGWDTWNSLYRPAIERLGVAAEPVTAAWLGRLLGRDADEVRERALLRWERLLLRERRRAAGDAGGAAATVETWRIVHRSFADFLAEKVDLGAAHRAVAEYYTQGLGGDWAAWDEYGLRHAATHLVAAARRRHEPERRQWIERLVRLVANREFQQQHRRRLGDAAALQRDLGEALRVAAGEDGLPAPLVALAALALIAFRREQLSPATLFELARAGNISAAERELGLYDVDPDSDWHRALLLTVAWLAHAQNPAGARLLRARVEGRLPAVALPPQIPLELLPLVDPLALLRARIAAVIDGAPFPQIDLPPAPAFEAAHLMLTRLGGSSDTSLLSAAHELLSAQSTINANVLAHGLAEGTSFLADQDGPLLVSLAVASPPLGEAQLAQYLAMHTNYSYVEYRRGSLWSLLRALLLHPQPEWVLEKLAAVGGAALAGGTEFQEGLVITLEALRAAQPAGSAAMKQLSIHWVRILSGVDRLQQVPGASDSWGSHKRRLCALAEALARLPGVAGVAGMAGVAGSPPDANALVDRALGLPFGFAGFQAPAGLTLAETIQVVRGDDGRAIGQALDAARAAAHNVQDATFCARTTARVNAMRRRWWAAHPHTFDRDGSVAVVERFVQAPNAPEFAALHRVGEQYEWRASAGAQPLPPALREANTLAALAQVYRRPLAESLRLNLGSGWAADEVLAPAMAGESAAGLEQQPGEVNVPDPGLAPLLAARFAAQALADPALADGERHALIRRLVPLAAANPTALDTVLSRLLLAARPDNAALLDELLLAAEQSVAGSGADVELAGELTAFVP